MVTDHMKELLRALPSVSALLGSPEAEQWLGQGPRAAVVAAITSALRGARQTILAGSRDARFDENDLLAMVQRDLQARSRPSLRRVINATGIVLHTGLGRAPLCEAAIAAIKEAAAGYCNLEHSLATGARGHRNEHVAEQLRALTGAAAATVVNNNAAATLLILRTLAAGREVVVSRGQLIEIGGSFRLPEIMSASGATLREVGTTNRTRLSDYAQAIHEKTAILLRAHPSNYRVVGFTEEVSIEVLAGLAHKHGLIAVDDLGSGAMVKLADFGLPSEPTVQESVAAGADLVCFSGDKLLGGPQCGLIVGRRHLIDQLDASPLMRTYRVDKLTLLALEATLRCYLDGDERASGIPALAMLASPAGTLAERARQLHERLEAALPCEQFFVCSSVGYAGGGALPARELPSVVVQWRPAQASTESVAAALRQAEVPVIARVQDDAICFDVRTIRETEFEMLVASALWAATQACDDDRCA